MKERKVFLLAEDNQLLILVIEMISVVFIGGMLGSKNDRPMLHSNITLKDFLRSTMNPNSYFKWTGPINDWEEQITQLEGMSYPVDLAEGRGLFQTDLHTPNPEPALCLTHPGVVEQSNFNTLNGFHLQVMGGRHILLFNHSNNMYPFPNIHRSYSYSQVLLEENAMNEDNSYSFSEIQSYRPYEVHLQPGDLLYVPAFWYARYASTTLSLSMSIHSESIIEKGLSSIYWKKLPLGLTNNDKDIRIAVIELYLRYLIKDSFHSWGYKDFLNYLYTSRFKSLFPLNYFRSGKGKSAYDNLKCPVEDDSEIADNNSALEVMLEMYDEKFREVLPVFQKIADETRAEIRLVEAPLDVIRGFLYDYTEELVRWALGPDKVVVYLYKCSKQIVTGRN